MGFHIDSVGVQGGGEDCTRQILEYYIIRGTNRRRFKQKEFFWRGTIGLFTKVSTHDQAAAKRTIANDMVQIIDSFCKRHGRF